MQARAVLQQIIALVAKDEGESATRRVLRRDGTLLHRQHTQKVASPFENFLKVCTAILRVG
jgi:hypothetical protein